MPMRMRDEQKDKALHVSCEGWTGIGFGVRLFADVCTDVAALAIQKEGGKAALRLFDPYAPAEDVFAGGWPKGVRIALYSNHYQHGLNQQKTTCTTLHRCRRARRCTSSTAIAACDGGVASRTRQARPTGRGEPRPFPTRNSKFIILNNGATLFSHRQKSQTEKLGKTRCVRAQASAFLRLLTEGF